MRLDEYHPGTPTGHDGRRESPRSSKCHLWLAERHPLLQLATLAGYDHSARAKSRYRPKPNVRKAVTTIIQPHTVTVPSNAPSRPRKTTSPVPRYSIPRWARKFQFPAGVELVPPAIVHGRRTCAFGANASESPALHDQAIVGLSRECALPGALYDLNRTVLVTSVATVLGDLRPQVKAITHSLPLRRLPLSKYRYADHD